MRYQCDLPDFEDCWFELSERWTRGELKAFFSERGESYLALIRRKITGIHMPTVDGAIDAPDALTTETIDNVDMILWRWFSTALNVGVDELYSMGEARVQRWSNEYAKQTAARLDKAKQN